MLNKDMLIELAKKLDLSSLLQLLASSKLINEKLNDVWIHKLQDFPEYKTLNIENLKDCYILLYKLTIFKNIIKEENIYNLYKRKILELFLGKLTSIPKEIDSLQNLKILSLVNNKKLIYLPKEICNLKNLEELDLFNNNLKEIPKEIGGLLSLKQFDLSCNQLRYIPKQIEQLSNLLYLNLYNNQLTTIPKEIGSLSKLQKINLYNNELTSIPKELFSNKNLQVFFSNS